METIKATVKSIRVFTNEDTSNVNIIFDKTFKGFAKQQNGTFAEVETNEIGFYRSALTAQLCDVNDDIALLRAMSEHSFGQREFGAILFGAKLEFTRELKVAGEEVNGKVLDRDKYFTKITGVTLTPRAIAAIDKATTL